MKNSSVAGVGCLFSVLASVAPAQTITRESVTPGGFEANSAWDAYAILVSGDGRRVAFRDEPSLIAGFGGNVEQLYWRDRQTGVVLPVSINLLGSGASNWSDGCALSHDGATVAFVTAANDLVPGDTNDHIDVFVRHMIAGVTSRVSVSSNGAQADADSQGASLSSDGRFVCFASSASNLVANDTNGHSWDVFVRDRITGTNQVASLTVNGAQADNSWEARISGNGNVVAFTSTSPDVVPGDTNNQSDVFVRDLSLGVTERVSVASNGAQAIGFSEAVGISDDGRRVLFWSDASNLVAGDTNNTTDAFVRDRVTNTTVRANLGLTGNETPGLPPGNSAMSDDGNTVVFAAPISGASWQILARDLTLNQTWVVSCRPNGQFGNQPSWSPSVSADGRFVGFETNSSNLVLGDTNSNQDVFVRDRHNTLGPPLLVHSTAKTNSAGCEPRIGASGAASVASPMSLLVTGYDFIDQAPGVLFWSSASSSIPFHGGTLCVAAPRVRLHAQSSSAPPSSSSCLGRFSARFDASYLAAYSLQPGDDVYAQYIARDPGYALPDNYALSAGLHFVVQP